MILNKVITKELKEDILKGNSKYIKNGMILFDEISFQNIDNGGVEIKIYSGHTHLVTYHQSKYKSGDTIFFHINKGLMKVELN